MRALVQRVREASVVADGDEVGRIGPGLCALIGVAHDDDMRVAQKMADKLWNLRIMDDAGGVMNLSVAETTGALLIVSQFTLYGDTRKGRRPSWIDAARPAQAEPIIEALVADLRRLGASVATGRFRTDMALGLVNDGPVTVMIEL